MTDNEHKMLTRSKRKKNLIELEELLELEFSEEEINDTENIEMEIKEEIPSKRVKFNDNDTDEQGNVKELIDYNFFEPITVERNNKEDGYNSEDYEYDSFDSEDYEDEEELLIGKLLSKYINNQMSNNKIENNELSAELREVLSKYNNKMIDYFETLGEEQQKEIFEIEKEIDSINSNTIPLRFQILKSKIDTDIKAIAVRKLETLQNLDSNSNEYHKIKGWVDGLLKIPFGIYKDLPINIKNTHSEITNYLVKANQILNNAVHGHKKAKCQILQIVSQWISNPRSKGSVFAIVGPMGNGKTTLVKEGIAKMIDRPFQFISLGGATEANFFDGHSYTYEGSQPGKIVDILQKSKCMNPVIYFDELDKVSETAKGEEIINLLIHMTDFSQNDHFIDKYYNNIPLDLSKALFIFSLNDMERVNPILRDRMYMIHTNKLELEDKITISKNYLIPNLCKEVALNKEDIEFSDDIIKFIIENYSNEDGVRNLRRTFETILSKLNIIRITKSCNIKDLELPFEIDNFSIPIKIDEEIVKKLVDIGKLEDIEPPHGMYT
jgi:ATP-dependent Lon protease